jgi:hypothetical protein
MLQALKLQSHGAGLYPETVEARCVPRHATTSSPLEMQLTAVDCSCPGLPRNLLAS